MLSVFSVGTFYPLIILAYHDLSRKGNFLSWMRVPVDDFERQIRMFKKIGNFIPPDDLNNHDKLNKNRLNFLLTFDDGYSNCHSLGFPVIKKYDIPALFFISTSNLESGEPFWFDKIIQPIQHNYLDSLDLSFLGLKNYQFSITGNSARWDDLQVLLEDVKQAAKVQGDQIIEEVILFLQHTCPKRETFVVKDECHPLNSQQIVEMHRSGLCHFGSHSHQHTILTTLSDDELNMELTKSREILEKIIGEKINFISYPNGDADERVKQACRNTGYKCGYTTNKEVAGYYPDEMYIPRVLIGGFDSVAVILWKVVKRLMLLRASAIKN